MDSDPYGHGISWPFRLGVTGIAESDGVARVEESMRVILGTQYGQRVMRPSYGSNLMTLVFAPNNSATANLARFYVEESLTRWEPRIEVVSVAAGPDDARGVAGAVISRSAVLNITVTYRLRGASDTHVFLYPFKLEPTS
jgi:Bacteriophage baseplate protein W